MFIPPAAITTAPVSEAPFSEMEVTPALAREIVPPKATVAPPERPVPGLMVIEELDRELLPILERVLFVPLIVLFVNT